MTTTWVARFVACLLALLVGSATPASASSTATTTSTSSGYVYDATAVARVDVHSRAAAGAALALLSDVREESASLSIGARGTSTTLAFTSVATNFGRLSEVSPGVYRSPQGLVYGPGSAQGHRVTHLMEHARPVSGKPVHSVFQTTAQDLPGPTDEVLGIVDDAWAIRGPAVPGDPGKFIVPMGRTVGTTGETSVTIIVKPGTSEIITAFPS